MTINNNSKNIDVNLFGGFEPRRANLSKIEKAQGFLRHFEWGFSPNGERKNIRILLQYGYKTPFTIRKRERAKPRW